MAIKALINRFNNIGRKDKDKALPDLPPAAAVSMQPSSSSSSSHPSSTSSPSAGTAGTRRELAPRRPLSTGPPQGEMMRLAPLEPLDTLLPSALLHSIPESPNTSHRTSATTTTSPRTPPAKTSPVDTRRKGVAPAPAPLQDQNGTQTNKRVAFISPPPTPGGLNTLALPPDPHSKEGKEEPRKRGNSFNGEASSRPDLSQQGRSEKGLKARTYSNPNADARAAASARGSGSRTLPSRQGVTSPTSAVRGGSSLAPPQQEPSNLAFSLRSGTPYSQHTSARSFVQAASSWSEAAEEDLVSNIGPRERTRQEVLWEIVTSEERYVQELLKMKETFIDPLLHPFAPPSSQVVPSSPLATSSGFPSLPEEPEDLYRAPSHAASSIHHPHAGSASPRESLDHLPIAARFLSSPTASPLMELEEGVQSSEDGEPADFSDFRRATSTQPQHQPQQGRSPYGQRTASGASKPPASANVGKPAAAAAAVPFPTRSHQSLPPPPRGTNAALSTISLGRNGNGRSETAQDVHPVPSTPSPQQPRTSTPASRIVRKLQKRSHSDADHPHNNGTPGISPQALPEDLRECLQVLERGILGGHVALSEMLRKRYEEQYPLVRSLADVFIQHSHILREYATYVLHLERALEQVDAFLSTDVKKKPKKQDAVEWMRISKILQRLEESAADKGETGLSICLSKPFQRLLKYPLLFQNLLYHTDPSTYEYESTLLMVAEVEEIVRSIEDEKILKEERDRTRDVFARIDGLDKVRGLAAPKPSRVLMAEKAIEPQGSTDSNGVAKDGGAGAQSQSLPSRNVKQKTSFRRLSENIMGISAPAMGSKKDLWLVTFNDVALRCQRTGVTTLPLALAQGLGPGGKSTSATELAKGKFGTTGRKANHTKPRNLYKFIKVETWAMPADPEEAKPTTVGVVSMEDITKTHAKLTQEAIADAGLADDDDGMESDESDRKSKMSFSYWGADKITVKRTPLSAASAAAKGAGKGTVARRNIAGNNARDSPANAKFGGRLRNPDHPPVTGAGGRPMSRTHGPVRRPTNASSTETRPPWGGNIGSATRVSTSTARKAQNATPTASPAARKESPVPETVRTTKISTTPSEDSGVGLYRQIIAANPSINKLNMM
ncbi:Dbl homology domain-containing protein [Calocera cornea HHB12733]|uniref:Dbl homology domain-containing protein n=1 Tax=Calocera cornea HHB12733 TaxID=1353952 RepID=A0A165ICV0_9BASI|nr:Dbl homology domain-containing protein [Calocera cornea HHB12733]